MVWRKTSTPRISAIISSVSRSRSGWTRATWSFETITLPSAERRSSILCLVDLSASEGEVGKMVVRSEVYLYFDLVR